MKLIHLGFADDLLLFCKGEPQTIQLLFDKFQNFSEASRLVANLSKSSMYCGGLSSEKEQELIDLLGFSKGRAQLIKSVLFSIQVFWAQVFILPKKVIKTIEATCRTFLWTGGTELSKRALLAWDRVCSPRVAGGLNILDMATWNKAAISKLLWNICTKKDKLWVKWIHSYYRNRDLLRDVPKQASWIIQKILKATKYFAQAGYSMDDISNIPSFSTKQFYAPLRGQFQKMSWRKLVCNNGGLPRWIFILRLAALGRLQTRDRLFKWGITTDQICPVCDREPESLNHLFFVCDVSAEIWQKLLNWIGIRKVPTHWTEELGWAELNAKGRNPQAKVYRMMLTAAVYYV
ncbi:uncharacterized protein LOC132617631 [Lycium barbarum]|uniref:uncharacterized protein LOC132617631 n=1 Tax=Lycium barbarum TaxID=112863 RepID=UPI00293F3764|nr:uncharacterized protein LOC132617631 [Lycium barbarum]